MAQPPVIIAGGGFRPSAPVLPEPLCVAAPCCLTGALGCYLVCEASGEALRACWSLEPRDRGDLPAGRTLRLCLDKGEPGVPSRGESSIS